MNAPPKKDDPRDFAAVMFDLPQAHAAMGDAIQKLVGAVRLTGKSGTVTLKLKIASHPNNDHVIDITPDVTLAVPKLPIRGGSFYPDKHDNVTKDDPATLWREDDLQDTPAASRDTGEIREI